MTIAQVVKCDEDYRDYEPRHHHRVYRRHSQKTPTSLIELLMGIFDTFYVTAKREERKIKQRHAIYPTEQVKADPVAFRELYRH